LVDPGPGRVAAAIVERGADLAVVEHDPSRADERRALLPQADAVRFAPETELLQQRWDLVAVEGDVGADDVMARRAAALAPGGRFVVVTDNRLSALRALDRARGKRAGTASVAGLPQLRRRLRKAGLRSHQEFGLLRSSLVPVTAFDLAAPRATAAVLAAAATHITGARRAGLAVITSVAGRRGVGLLPPAWLVVARRAGDSPPLRPDRLTGRIGYERTAVIKLLRGEPPASVEKRYPDAEAAAAEAMALDALAGAGIAPVARLEARKGPDRSVLSWLPGATLHVQALPEQELERWTERAATLLGEIQRRTRRADGTVLVHGDFWLGNVLVAGDRIVGIIDWVGAHCGDAADDRGFLGSSLFGFRATNPALMARLAAAVERGAGPRP
jgi:hypothetical protein